MIAFPLRSAGAAVLVLSLWSCQPSHSSEPAPAGGAALQATAVRVGTLTTKTVERNLELNGILRADQDVVVKAETQGRITAITVNVGDHVKAGQTLALVDDVIKRATNEANQANLSKLKKDLDRVTLLKAQNVSSDTDLDNIRLAVATAESQAVIAAKDLDNTRIRAPFDGVVTEKLVSLGAMVSFGVPVVHLISLDDLKIVVNVNEKDILQVKPGDAVEVRSDVAGGGALTGKVRSISPQASSAQNFPVEITVRNPAQHPLLDGMSVTVGFRFGARSVAVIPRAALVGSVQSPQVYLVRDGHARLAALKVGSEFGTDLEVLGGLSAADQVVVSGQNNLQDGVAVDVLP